MRPDQRYMYKLHVHVSTDRFQIDRSFAVYMQLARHIYIHMNKYHRVQTVTELCCLILAF